MLLGLSLDRGMADQVVVFAAELPGQVLACRRRVLSARTRGSR